MRAAKYTNEHITMGNPIEKALFFAAFSTDVTARAPKAEIATNPMSIRVVSANAMPCARLYEL